MGLAFSKLTGKAVTSAAKLERNKNLIYSLECEKDINHLEIEKFRLHQAAAAAEISKLREELAFTRAELCNIHADIQSTKTIVLREYEFGIKALRIISLLSPKNVPNIPFVRKGRNHDGGYVMLDSGLENAVAYSLGIGNDVSWDLALTELGCDIFQYDHTIAALPVLHKSFHWFPIAIGEVTLPDRSMATLSDLVKYNGHTNRNDIILKVDIEGSEWSILPCQAEIMELFSQIIVEFHRFSSRDLINPAIKIEELDSRISVLQKLNQTHQVVHVHGNNFAPIGIMGGVPLPDVMEVTYVRRRDFVFVPCNRLFPTELDMPCDPTQPDYYLGAWGSTGEVSSSQTEN